MTDILTFETACRFYDDEYKRPSRQYQQGRFTYLLDDEKKTAWIKRGYIGRCKRYRVPDHVMVGEERYTVESIEIGAFNAPKTLRHLVIPDSISYIDEDTLFGFANLRSVFVGKGVQYIDSWNFRCCPKLRVLQIDKDNPYMKIEDGMVLSRDGKFLFVGLFNRQHITIPEGVEKVNLLAFYYHSKLETVHFPSTLREISDNSFSSCPKLRRVNLPEGFEKCVVQSFMENENLNVVDIPSTFSDSGREPFSYCPNLRHLVLRTPQVLSYKNNFEESPIDKCTIYVPSNLVEQYRSDVCWGRAQRILPLEDWDKQEK